MKPLNLAIICIVLLIAGVLFWPTLYRYDKTTELMQVGDYKEQETVLIKINRLTGYTEVFKKGKWVSEEKAKAKVVQEKPIPCVVLPKSERAKLICRGSFSKYSRHEFWGSFYNDTDWTIKEMQFRVIVTGKDGVVKWNKTFWDKDVSTSPWRSGNFSFALPAKDYDDTFSFGAIEVRGYK